MGLLIVTLWFYGWLIGNLSPWLMNDSSLFFIVMILSNQYLLWWLFTIIDCCFFLIHCMIIQYVWSSFIRHWLFTIPLIHYHGWQVLFFFIFWEALSYNSCSFIVCVWLPSTIHYSLLSYHNFTTYIYILHNSLLMIDSTSLRYSLVMVD